MAGSQTLMLLNLLQKLQEYKAVPNVEYARLRLTWALLNGRIYNRMMRKYLFLYSVLATYFFAIRQIHSAALP